jgi:molybdopterin-guanine dinucleotide biosynthesis protein B
VPVVRRAVLLLDGGGGEAGLDARAGFCCAGNEGLAVDTPIVTVIGKSGSGKTTMLEKLVPEFKRRGYRLATVKHHSHCGFDIDKPGKDSWRFAQAGSDHVVIAAPDKVASYHKVDHELSLEEIAAGITDMDLILVEGYKQANMPSLEVVRAENSTELIGSPEQRFAVAADFPLDLGVPQFGLDDILAIVDLIEERYLRTYALLPTRLPANA